MKKCSYAGQDYTFGQMMLTLRTAIGLTQQGLATLLGVSRKSIGDWETGRCYPNAEHLKEVIALGVKQQSFTAGREVEDIRALWRVAHQKVFLDEPWLTTLLGNSRSLPTPVVPTQKAQEPQVDWGEALYLPNFYGRAQELETLLHWVLEDGCGLVSVLGMGGIGKSALVVHAMRQMAEHFEVVIFRALRDAPDCSTLLESCLQVLSPRALALLPQGLEPRLKLLLDELRHRRVLLVLDNLESLLAEGDLKGRLRPGFEAYGRLLRQVAESGHQSCVLLTSREKPVELRAQESKWARVRSLRLLGLDVEACEQLLTEHEVLGTAEERACLVEMYAGNPLALRIVAQPIADLFGGDISLFFSADTAIFGGITDLLEEQWTRLSPLEQAILSWLAIVREPVTLEALRYVLIASLAPAQVLEAMDGLLRRSLIERGQHPGSFTLQAVVLEFVTNRLVSTVSEEIRQGRLSLFLSHSFSLAQAKEYVRQTQERLLVAPVLACLQSASERRGDIEELLLSLLEELRSRAETAQGYGPANLIALLRLLRGHLRGIDLSRLSIRGAYLQGVEMQDATLAFAIMHDTAFTEALDAIWSVATSPDGKVWAAGSSRGEVRVWREGGQILHLAWQAHTDVIYTLAFSPDGLFLATASWDGAIALWNADSGALLWRGRQTNGINSLTFAADGSLLASGGHDATVRLWETRSGRCLQVLEHAGPVYVVAWSPDRHLLACGDAEGQIRLWEIQPAQPATCIHIHTGHTNRVMGLAFAPDGRSLVSVSWDLTVKLWEVREGGDLHLRQALTEHTDWVNRVAWSPDGRFVASCGLDKTIWLWDVARGSYRAALHGHTAAIYGITFTPDSSRVLSGSQDGTLCVWDVERGQCMHIIQGYAVSSHGLDWSPDGLHLASGDTDMVVTLWEVNGGRLPRTLRGHSLIAPGVAWSPDGRFLASCGWDNAIRVWDATSGNCVLTLRDSNYADSSFNAVAWSPDGHMLACGTYMRGVQVWDMTTHRRRWVGGLCPAWIYCVAWSPDGTRLAGCGDNGNLSVWEASGGTLLQQLPGHQGKVMSVAWSPDGTRLASAGGSGSCGELIVWEVQSGQIIRTMAEHPGAASAVSWDPSGERLVSGSSDGRLCWWDLQNGTCVQMQQAHQGTIQALKVSPDGCVLASCGDDGAIRLWNLQSGELLRTMRRDRPYERMKITGIQGLTRAEIATLHTLGAVEAEADEQSRQVEPLHVSNEVQNLAAPNWGPTARHSSQTQEQEPAFIKPLVEWDSSLGG